MAKPTYKTSPFLKQSQVPEKLRRARKNPRKPKRATALGTDLRTITKITRYNRKPKKSGQTSKHINSTQESQINSKMNMSSVNVVDRLVGSDSKHHKLIPTKKSTKKNKFNRYIHRLRKHKMGPNFTASRATIESLSNFVTDMFEKLAVEASTLMKNSKRRTLSDRDIRGAVRIMLPQGLACDAMCYAGRAMNLYNNIE